MRIKRVILTEDRVWERVNSFAYRDELQPASLHSEIAKQTLVLLFDYTYYIVPVQTRVVNFRAFFDSYPSFH